jgi:nitrate ABC transporter permease subunit
VSHTVNPLLLTRFLPSYLSHLIHRIVPHIVPNLTRKAYLFLMTTTSTPRTSAVRRAAPKIDFLPLIAPIVCTFIFLALWQIIFNAPDTKMPGPIKVISQTGGAIVNGFGEGGIWLQLFESLKRVAVGYTMAAVIGVGVGVAIGVNRFLRLGFDPLIQILRTIPPLAWLPISLAIFQDGKPAAVFLIFVTAIWPIIINTAVGVQQIPKDYTNVSKVLRLSGVEFFFNILIPSTVPYIFTGLRIGVGLAWLAIVAAEMLASGAGGIGFYIWDAYNAGNENSMSQIILAVFCVGIVGLLLDRFVGWLGSLIVAE